MPKMQLNKGSKIVLVAHFLFNGAVGIMAPFLAIFHATNLEGVALTEIGIGSTIFFLTAGVLAPVIGFTADKIKGLKDETMLVFYGFLIWGVTFFLYSYAQNYWHLYLFNFILGIGRAMFGAPDKTVFSYFIPKTYSNLVWGIDDSLITIGAAFGAMIGGYYGEIYGLRNLLQVQGVLTVAAGVMYLLVAKELKKDKIWKGY